MRISPAKHAVKDAYLVLGTYPSWHKGLNGRHRSLYLKVPTARRVSRETILILHVIVDGPPVYNPSPALEITVKHRGDAIRSFMRPACSHLSQSRSFAATGFTVGEGCIIRSRHLGTTPLISKLAHKPYHSSDSANS